MAAERAQRAIGARPRGARSGYALRELLVSLTLFLGFLVVVLAVFNLNYRLARDRAGAAARQAALRSVQHDLESLVRQAGSGGLPHEVAIAVRNNVPAGATIGGAATPRVVAGSDVLILRGVFSTPILEAHPVAGAAALELRDPSFRTGAPQSLGELAAALESEAPERDSLLLVSGLDDSVFAVVEADPAASTVTRRDGRVTAITLGFRPAGAPGPLAPAGAVDAALRGPVFTGILEEYRIWVREGFAVPGDASSPPRPRLAMARFAPGTERLHAAGPVIDLVEEVFDLQIALAADLDGDGLLEADPSRPGADEWLYNAPGGDGTEHWPRRPRALDAVRLTTVAWAALPGTAPATSAAAPLEDRAAPPAWDDRPLRPWRLESRIDL